MRITFFLTLTNSHIVKWILNNSQYLKITTIIIRMWSDWLIKRLVMQQQVPKLEKLVYLRQIFLLKKIIRHKLKKPQCQKDKVPAVLKLLLMKDNKW